jgi:flavin-dependent dehydrogenase
MLAAKRLLLVGDAAGLVEPLTGEGISYACHSADIAAKAVTKWFDDEHAACEAYSQGVKRDIGGEIAWARRLLTLAVSFPKLFYWAFKNSDDIWITFCKVLRGETTFESLRNRILGPLKVLGAPIDSLLARREHRRMDLAQVDELFAESIRP